MSSLAIAPPSRRYPAIAPPSLLASFSRCTGIQAERQPVAKNSLQAEFSHASYRILLQQSRLCTPDGAAVCRLPILQCHSCKPQSIPAFMTFKLLPCLKLACPSTLRWLSLSLYYRSQSRLHHTHLHWRHTVGRSEGCILTLLFGRVFVHDLALLDVPRVPLWSIVRMTEVCRLPHLLRLSHLHYYRFCCTTDISSPTMILRQQ